MLDEVSDAAAGEEPTRLLGRICTGLDQIREMIPDNGQAELERIVTGLRQGDEDVAGLQRELHELLRRAEVAGGLGLVARGAGIGGLPPLDGHPLVEALVCPRDRCARAVSVRDRKTSRECLLYGEPLRLCLLS